MSYAKHIEDLVLVFGMRYEFIQLKSRGADHHLWRASEMCDDGGGVDSLVRAYSIAKDADCTFELHLEGGASPSKDTNAFVTNCATLSDSPRKKAIERLKDAGLSKSHLDDFIGRLRIRPKQPAQTAVNGQCIQSLVHLVPGTTGCDILELAGRLVSVVEGRSLTRALGHARRRVIEVDEPRDRSAAANRVGAPFVDHLHRDDSLSFLDAGFRCCGIEAVVRQGAKSSTPHPDAQEVMATNHEFFRDFLGACLRGHAASVEACMASVT